jgi:hypothetical protein
MGLSLSKNKTRDRSKVILINLLKGGLLGIVLGYFFALLLGRSVWVEMRFNLGLIIPVCTLACMLLFLWKRVCIRYSFFLFLELSSLIAFFLIYRFEPDALLVIPACLLREGCHLTWVSLYSINIVLGSILFTGNLVWIFHEICWKLRRITS